MSIEQLIRAYHRVPDFSAASLGIPETCSFCGSPLDIYPESDVHIWCPNPTCSRKLYGNLLKFCEKMDLRSLGVVSLQALAETRSVKSASDLFTLSKEDFLKSIPRAGDKAYENFQEGLAKLKATPSKLTTLLASLNIPFCGEGSWELLLTAECFAGASDWSTLKHYLTSCSLTSDGWVSLVGAVPRLADRAVETIFYNRIPIADEMIALLEHLSLRQATVGGALSGKKFCQTGGLTRINATTGKRVTRNDLISMIEANGGTWSDTVDKLTLLIIDDVNSTSSKAVKARKCGATLLTEADFFNLLGG